MLFKNGKLIFSIRVPQATTIAADAICAINFVQLGIPFESSIKHVIPNTIIPIKNPNIFIPYFSSPNKLIDFSIFIIINK